MSTFRGVQAVGFHEIHLLLLGDPRLETPAAPGLILAARAYHDQVTRIY
jgi:hypothetical protein